MDTVANAYKAYQVVSGGAAAVFTKILDFALSMLVAVMAVLGKFIALLGGWVANLVTWQGTSSSLAIDRVWTILRDMCNMGFIILLIVISFATIFSVFPRFQRWNIRSALFNVIVAALLLNFSLAIGQTITGFGNMLTKTMAGIVPDLGQSLADTLKPALALVNTAGSEPTKSVAPSPLDPQSITTAEQTRFNACIKEGAPTTVEKISSAVYSFFTGTDTQVAAAFKSPEECRAELAAARQKADQSEFTNLGPNAGKVFLIVSAIMNVFLLLIVASCLGTALTFLILRIIAIWLLLALSPLAFFSIALPAGAGGDGFNLSTWFSRIIGWNLFGPLYLLCIGLGLTFLSGQSEFLLLIVQQGGSIGPWYSFVQLLVFYVFAAVIFIGGLAVARTSTFATAVKGTQVVGAWAQGLGVFDTAGAAPLKRLSYDTGLTAAGKGVQQGLNKRFVEPYLQRGERYRTDVEARFQKFAGDKSAMESLQRKRIDEQLKRNKEGGATVSKMREDFKAGPTAGPKYFAAAKALLDEGELTDQEMLNYSRDAAKVSKQYGQATREAVQKKVKERVKEKKYRKVDDILAVMQQLGLDKPENSRELKSFLGSLKGSQPLLYAKLAGQTRIANDNGQPLTTSDILEETASKLSDDEWIQAFEEGLPLGENAEYIFDSKLKGKGAAKLLRTAKKETRTKLADEIRRRKAGGGGPTP